MATRILGGQTVGVPSFLSSSTYRTSQSTKITHPPSTLSVVGSRLGASLRIVSCSAVQESSGAASAAAPTTIPSTNGPAVSVDSKEAEAAPKEAAAKPKKPAKAPAKPLPQLMEEEVIPPLKEILQAQDDLTELELTFLDNRLEGYFRKKGNPYSFWAFFPTGDLTGPKGFSISSYGSEASTVEPFLVDEKKVTANHVIFWVEKRLAAQGIIPVWNE